jgi:hypothetical protein
VIFFSRHGADGAEEVAEEGEGIRRDRSRQAKKAQPVDRKTIAISQAAVGTADSK